MMNLFSIFDPHTNMSYSLNWSSMFFIILVMNFPFWLIPSNYYILWMQLNKFIINEFKILLNKISMKNLLMFSSLFNLIMLINIMGLFPYIFTPSSHMSFTLSLSFMMWLSFMMFGWLINNKNMFIHLIPTGTPYILMPFMVLIESISNIIRPGTLAIRLSANMIAGHLLLNLIGSSNFNLMILPMTLTTQTLLMILEISVACIQAYVFSILSTLYSNEVS